MDTERSAIERFCIFCLLILVIGLTLFMIDTCSAVTNFEITTDHITDTGIVWNISKSPQSTISYIDIYLDGIEISPDTTLGFTEIEDTDIASRQIIIQSNLRPGEWHSIFVNVTASGIIYHGSAIAQTTSTGDFAVWQQILVYLWAIAAIILMVLGFSFFRIFHLISAFFSLIGIVMQIQPTLDLTFQYISFWIYIILLIFGLVCYALNMSRGKNYG